MKNGTQIIIEKMLVETGVKKKDVAQYLGMSPENFSARLRTGKFTYDELQRIAAAMGCELNFGFVQLNQQKTKRTRAKCSGFSFSKCDIKYDIKCIIALKHASNLVKLTVFICCRGIQIKRLSSLTPFLSCVNSRYMIYFKCCISQLDFLLDPVQEFL